MDIKEYKANFKYFVKITKAVEAKDGVYIEGVASGTMEDQDEERMSIDVLRKFVKAIPLPLTSNHPKFGSISADMGEVVEAKLLDDEHSSLFIKARLDMDHPEVPFMLKKLREGKKFAFSIEGMHAEVQNTWSERLQKYVTEFVDMIPLGISITTEPSYMGSFLDVVTKSYERAVLKSEGIDSNETSSDNEDNTDPVNLTNEEKMDEEKKTVEEVAEEVVTTEEEKVEEVVEEEVVEEVTEEKEEEIKEEVETEEATDEATQEDKEDSEKEETPAESQEEDESGETEKSAEANDLLSKVLARIDEVGKAVEELQSESKAVAKANLNITKALHKEVETIKKMSVGRKSKAYVAEKGLVEKATEGETDATFKSVAEKVLS